MVIDPLLKNYHHGYYPDPIDLVPLHHQVELLVNLVVLCLRSRGQCELLIISDFHSGQVVS